MIQLLLKLPDRSFFLFGPRGTGKSTWLRKVLPAALSFDLLEASLFLELTREPHRHSQRPGMRHRHPRG
jgi:predicted AAA+ superfamily ATPase